MSKNPRLFYNNTVVWVKMLSLYISSISANPFTADPIKASHFATPYQSTQMSKIKNGRLDQYGAEPFEQQQVGTAGVEGVNANGITSHRTSN